MTMMTATDARNAVRTLIQDGQVPGEAPWNLVRLEDLSDQIEPAATPTGKRFTLRFSRVLGGQVSVQAVPGTLVAYIDGAPSPVAPAQDADANGVFELAVAPVNRLQVTYAWQLLGDASVDRFVAQAVAWLGMGDITEVPARLQVALTHWAAADALMAIARRVTLADQSAGEAEASLSQLAERCSDLAKQYRKDAIKARDDYYQDPAKEQPAATALGLDIPRYEPWR